MEFPSFARSQRVALSGATLMIVGAALPWTGGPAAILYRPDQFVGILAGVSVLGIVVIRPWTILEWVGVALFGGIVGYLGVRALPTLVGTAGGVETGLIVQLAGGALAIGGGAYATVEMLQNESGTSGDDERDGGRRGSERRDGSGVAESEG